MIRRLAKIVLAMVLFVVGYVAIAVGSIELLCAPPAATTTASRPAQIDDSDFRRPEANTYFTFPEWYIVYSFEDFGRFLDTKSESAFPYFSQIAGFWRSYCAVNRIGAGLPGDHFQYKAMIHVIGLSFTAELAVKGLYENTIGRLTEWLRGPAPNPEDEYARKVTQDYAAFMHQVPWYKFDFPEKLRGLWSETPLIGGNPARSVERKASLSAEYLVKTGYARLIGLTVSATYGPDELEITFVTRGDPAPILTAEPTVKMVKALPDGMALLQAPRYAVFTELLKRLAAANVDLVEIGGNRRIMLSAIVPEAAKPTTAGLRELFALPVDARPGMVRVGYDLDVSDLSHILATEKADTFEVEHVYDY